MFAFVTFFTHAHDFLSIVSVPWLIGHGLDCSLTQNMGDWTGENDGAKQMLEWGPVWREIVFLALGSFGGWWFCFGVFAEL